MSDAKLLERITDIRWTTHYIYKISHGEQFYCFPVKIPDSSSKFKLWVSCRVFVILPDWFVISVQYLPKIHKYTTPLSVLRQLLERTPRDVWNYTTILFINPVVTHINTGVYIFYIHHWAILKYQWVCPETLYIWIINLRILFLQAEMKDFLQIEN